MGIISTKKGHFDIIADMKTALKAFNVNKSN